MSTMTGHYTMFAAYNRWANERIYEAARGLPEADYRADRGAFFGSLHRTLNHILVADRIWMQRFTGDGPVHTRLDEILFENLRPLEAARRDEDERIIAYVDSLDESTLAGLFSFRTITNPRDMTQPLAPALAHFFNHQTQHRGQAHCLLTEVGGHDAAPSLDLIMFQRATGIGLGS
jgi:uncharacterized damage-inducible protein DinB